MTNIARLSLRLLLLSPVLALLGATAALLAQTPASWGAASEEGIADWVIPASGLVLALPALAIGLGAAWLIVSYTRRPFRVFWPHLPLAALPLVAAYLLLLLATRIADPATYVNLRDPSSGQSTSSAAVLVMTVVIAIFAHGVLWACAYIYAEAFSEEKPAPAIDLDAGVDRVGQMLEKYAPRH